MTIPELAAKVAELYREGLSYHNAVVSAGGGDVLTMLRFTREFRRSGVGPYARPRSEVLARLEEMARGN